MSSPSKTPEIIPKFHKKLQLADKYASNSGLKLLRSSNKAFTINYFFENGEKVQISLDLPSEHTVSQSILATIRAINSQLPAGVLLLKPDPKMYNLHFTKKNGKAKDDLPALDMGLSIGDVGVFVFCLKEKEEFSSAEDSDAHTSIRGSVASAKLNYQSPLILKKEISSERRDLKMENKGFWAFFFCRC